MEYHKAKMGHSEGDTLRMDVTIFSEDKPETRTREIGGKRYTYTEESGAPKREKFTIELKTNPEFISLLDTYGIGHDPIVSKFHHTTRTTNPEKFREPAENRDFKVISKDDRKGISKVEFWKYEISQHAVEARVRQILEERYEGHEVYVNGGNISVYKKTNLSLIAAANGGKHINLHTMSLKLDREGRKYFVEQPEYWKNYEIVGTTESDKAIGDLAHEEIEVCDYESFMSKYQAKAYIATRDMPDEPQLLCE